MIVRTCRLLLLLSVLAALLSADGGTLQVRQTSGPFVLSVFTSPAVPRAGLIDFSVLIQQAAGLDPVLDADVEVRAESSSGIVVSKAASHDNAQNKLLYAASLDLPTPGEWTFEVLVHQRQGSARVTGRLIASTREPRFLAHWPQWIFIPLLLLVFTFHQWLKSHQPVPGGRLIPSN
jgi:hypothetical protein